MQLVDAHGSAPPHAIVSPVVTRDGPLIRTARWPRSMRFGDAAPIGTVVVCTGRSEFIEKYFEVVADLTARGFAVVVFDWRGQGLSDRALRNPRKGHVADFADYERDLAALVAQVLEPFCPKPWFALAHSMGGTVALGFAARSPHVFRRLVLSAPMIAIARLRFTQTLRATARWWCRMGLAGRYIPGRRRHGLTFSSFADNPLTSDPERYARTAGFLRAEPRLGVGAPTIGWIDAAFDAMASLDEDTFGRDFTTPTLTVMPGADVVVDVRAAERLTRRLRGSQVVLVPGCRHEILMERDTFRDQFWAAFDAFVPGTP